jgi:hypothetical protein
MKLRNRDINVEPTVQGMKRVIKKLSPQVIKRKKSKFDYDEKLLNDPNSVANFASDIFQYLKTRERAYQLPISLKENISEKNRALVVDWIIDCQDSYSYYHETMYTAIRLFDIFLAATPSHPTNKLQLVAASSFLIASKVEQYNPANVATLQRLCENQYTKDEIKAMEIKILKAAQYDLGFPLAYAFLRRYSQVIDADMKTLTLARFCLEVATHYIGWSLESPSKIAAVCMVLALKKTNSKLDWEPILEHYSGYQVADIGPLLENLEMDIKNFKMKFPKCKLVILKYSQEAFYEVAKEFLD